MKHKPARPALRGGGYSLVLTAMLAAALILVNVTVQMLPANLTKFDMSAAKLYSVTSNTKDVVSNLEQDVTVYWIAQPDQEDEILRNLLDRYESLSDHIRVLKRNPDVYPAFAETYTDEPVQNNSLVVESGDRSRFIAFDEIYIAQGGPNGSGYSASFDGEGVITSAIDYCVNAEQPVLYQLEGHGELALPEFFLDQLKKANMEVRTLSLLNTDQIPEDCAVMMIHGPSTDLSPEEVSILTDYTASGGKLLVLAGPTPEGMLPNLYQILADYGVSTQEGIIVESDRTRYAFRTPYILLPQMQPSPVTDPLIQERYYPIAPIAQGLNTENAQPSVQVLLQTSETAFNKPEGFSMQDYEKGEDVEEKTYALGVRIDTEHQGQIVWISSSMFLDPLYNAYSSGANGNLAMNALAQMAGGSENLAIRSKTLSYQYLTIPESTAGTLKGILIGGFPLMFLAAGAAVVLTRRKEQHK